MGPVFKTQFPIIRGASASVAISPSAILRRRASLALSKSKSWGSSKVGAEGQSFVFFVVLHACRDNVAQGGRLLDGGGAHAFVEAGW